MKSDRCRHGYEVNKNGNHIIPKEKSTAELIDEAKKLLQKPSAETASPKPLTKQQQEFEAHIQKWKKYYEEKRGKISNEFPKTIFDKHEE